MILGKSLRGLAIEVEGIAVLQPLASANATGEGVWFHCPTTAVRLRGSNSDLGNPADGLLNKRAHAGCVKKVHFLRSLGEEKPR